MFNRLRPLAPYLKRYWKPLAWGGVSTIFYNVVKVLIPLVIGHAIDDMHAGITEQKIIFHSLRLIGLGGVLGDLPIHHKASRDRCVAADRIRPAERYVRQS